MLVISSREFRQKQKEYLDRVDQGEHIIVQRGKDKAYTLTAVRAEDMYFNAEMVKRIQKSLKEIDQGEYQDVNSTKEISDLLGL